MNDRERHKPDDENVTVDYPADTTRPQESTDTSVESIDLAQTLAPTPLTAASDPKQIGRYTVVQCLGKGGQGAVYRAIHPSLPIELAIKVSTHKLDAAAHHALQDEAQILCELEHPHIARVRDLDFDQGLPFLVLDFIRGRSLDELLASGQPPREQLVQWLASVASAIDYAHRRGVLHLDLKPGNIVIDEQDRAKVIDFGMARMRGAWSDSSLEADGISGTLSYMSPEQASGRAQKIGSRSDIFALGAILYRILTGQPPFRGSTISETLASVRECRFDADRLDAVDAPRHWIEACRKAMQSDPAKRFASAKEFAEAIAPAAAPALPSAQRQTSMSFSFLGITITLAVSFLLLIALTANWLSSSRDIVAVNDPLPDYQVSEQQVAGSAPVDMSLPMDAPADVAVQAVPSNPEPPNSELHSPYMLTVPADDVIGQAHPPLRGATDRLSVRSKGPGDTAARSLQAMATEEYLALRDLLRQTIGIDGARVNLQADLKRFLNTPAATSWPNIQRQATADRDKLTSLIAELDQLQSAFVVDEMESYRQLRLDLNRKLRLYEQLIERDADSAVQDLPAVQKIADEFTELIQKIRQHEVTVQKYLQANKPADPPALP